MEWDWSVFGLCLIFPTCNACPNVNALNATSASDGEEDHDAPYACWGGGLEFEFMVWPSRCTPLTTAPPHLVNPGCLQVAGW